MKKSIINIDPEILGGTPVFRGTRVPIQVLFDVIQYDSLEEFFEGYPHISREMVDEVFEIVRKKFIVKQGKQQHLYENFA
jgi:uncharacterized protein (DUF433 family)